MRVLFWDGTCPTPYDLNKLNSSPMGGTEATVVRIATALASYGIEVTVKQHNRSKSDIQAKVNYEPTYLTLDKTYTHIVVLRDPMMLAFVKERWPKAKTYLWLHDLAPVNFGITIPYMKDSTVVTVSNWHREQVKERLLASEYNGSFPLKTIYNPIDDDLTPNETPIDKNKLVFFSSPHKGLDYALFSFGRLREFLPDLRLYIANPGYFPSRETNDLGVVNYGSLSHTQILNEVRSSFCVYYPNTVYPETFGLVFAEANAVGTPVFTHRHGAAREILGDEIQPADLRETKKLIERFLSWYNGTRPIIKANPKFRVSEVIKEWIQMLK